MENNVYAGPGIKLSDIVNPYTFNIFTDASILNRKKYYDGCYGAIAVYDDQVIDSYYRIASETTNNNSEIKGLRAGVFLALKYKPLYRVINIFSDSQISVFGIRDRLLYWSVDQITQQFKGKSGDPISSQDIFVEIVYLMLQYDLRVNFIHQKGHVKNDIRSLREAEHVFRTSNGIRGRIDLNMIRFISKWNDIVDTSSRSTLLAYDQQMKYKDPIEFFVAPFDRSKFSQLSKNTIKKGVYE